MLIVYPIPVTNKPYPAGNTFNEQWQFSKPGAEWSPITIPHTWNKVDMQTTKNFYQGVAQYKKPLRPIPPGATNACSCALKE
ncbi:hypothetical protein [Paraflavitalea speifideaquila]|uniref:hypothetical protein n=1 Tax=Paraflavitalea speifideaquila TaxID=3076558 RepID=UPI0028EF58B6|nr:hypothetical protein [Paraflavitalea speifideiaquila]